MLSNYLQGQKRPLMQRRVIYEQLSYYMSTVHAVHEGGGGMRGVVGPHVPPPAVKTKPKKLHNDIGIYSIHTYTTHNVYLLQG